jgi:hypothetical protein
VLRLSDHAIAVRDSRANSIRVSVSGMSM